MEPKQQIINKAPTILVLFGATGDLTVKKIIPSLWYLFGQGRLPERLTVIGFSRRNFSAREFKKFVLESLKKRGGENIHNENFSRFFKIFSYQQGAFEDGKAFRALSDKITKLELDWGVCANKLFYLAVPPSNYEHIFENLAKVKLNLPCGGDLGWSRILVEKPFGTDLTSAKNLQVLLTTYFKEEQIYRIDHYLFKEIVQGIENFRFSNNLFENVWDNTTIEHINLRLHETIGVEDRGSFYDAVGAFRDVGQNHLLIMLAAITMEYPSRTDVAAIRNSRSQILETFLPWTRDSIKKNTFRAEYRGYKTIRGVKPGSDTETYFALKTELYHPRWKGVTITMESGKRMKEARKEIVLTLKHPLNCYLCKIGRHNANRIVFRLEPNDEIVIHFWTKKPGFERTLEERTFSFFLYEKLTKMQYVEEYSKVLYHAIQGIQSLFISQGEVESMWKFTDPVIEGWRKNLVPLSTYNADSTPNPQIIQDALDVMDKKEKSQVKKIGIVGLGKMGANLARQLSTKEWSVYGFNRTPDVTKKLASEGIIATYSLSELIGKLPKPAAIWLMVSYRAVDELLEELVPLLEKNDTIIEGGNSPYQDSIRRARKLKNKGINFLDAGVSGGPNGARYGVCVMVGGEKEIYQKYERLFKDVSVKKGFSYVGSSGAGHFVKMIHNGIEYGMMQSLGEGFEILHKAPFRLDLHEVANLYNHGSVITSSLIGWLAQAYAKFGDDLNNDECCCGKVSQSGEGLWTVETAKKLGVAVNIIKGAVDFRTKSQKKSSYAGRVVSALRNQFGGHTTGNKKP